MFGTFFTTQKKLSKKVDNKHLHVDDGDVCATTGVLERNKTRCPAVHRGVSIDWVVVTDGTCGTGLERLHTGTYLPVTTVVDISEPARQYPVASTSRTYQKLPTCSSIN
jgi:hypothetical protein